MESLAAYEQTAATFIRKADVMKRNVATPPRAAIAGLLVVACATIAAGQTAPTFTIRGPFPIGNPNPREAVAVDFDHDGDLDLLVTTGIVVAPGSDQINFLVNDGTGLLSKQNSVALASPNGIAVADFNSDGALDVAATTGGAGAPCGQAPGVAIYLGDSPSGTTVTFQPPCLTNVVVPIAVQAGDFNSDLIPDLAVATNTNGIRIFLGNGNGTFQPGQLILSSVVQIRDMAPPLDLNGDTFLDLAVAYNAGFRTFFGNGAGTFQIGGNTTPGGQMVAIAAGEITGDGIPDLVEISAQTLRIDRGVGNTSFIIGGEAPVGPGLLDVALTDLNSDGHLDIVIAGGAQVGLRLLLNNGTGTFVQSPIPGVGAVPQRAVPGDWNGDGAGDLAVVDFNNSQVFVALQNVVDQIPPTVDITTPADGSTVSGMVTVSATAADNKGVDRVEFFANEAPIGSSVGPDFSIMWDASALAGSFTIRARAFDAAGNFADDSNTVTVLDIAPPSVPADLTGTVGRKFDAVLLSWTPASDNVGVAYYRIYEFVRKNSHTSTWELVADHVAQTSKIVEIRKRRGHAHIFAVIAVDAAGNESAQSDSVSVSKDDRDRDRDHDDHDDDCDDDHGRGNDDDHGRGTNDDHD
jgi:hypothetical protein